MQDSASTVRRTYLFLGRVQGVGFRYTTCGVAETFDVAGYVRNLKDGSVEAVVEGQPDEISRFIDAVGRAMAGCIRETRVRESPATGEFSSFGIQQ